jgi:hypothetical protein
MLLSQQAHALHCLLVQQAQAVNALSANMQQTHSMQAFKIPCFA